MQLSHPTRKTGPRPAQFRLWSAVVPLVKDPDGKFHILQTQNSFSEENSYVRFVPQYFGILGVQSSPGSQLVTPDQDLWLWKGLVEFEHYGVLVQNAAKAFDWVSSLDFKPNTGPARVCPCVDH